MQKGISTRPLSSNATQQISFWRVCARASNDILDFMPISTQCLRHLKRADERVFPYWLAFPRMAGSYEKRKEEEREKERKAALDIHSFGKREKHIYKREQRRRARTYSSSYCLDIGALIVTTMYQLPACYLHDMLTSLVSVRALGTSHPHGSVRQSRISMRSLRHRRRKSTRKPWAGQLFAPTRSI